MFIGDKKYACATCIKGHRSSSCAHTDRPLIEVKKKGRPVTQCEHCRDLRKTKQVHIKCVCVSRPDKDDAGEENPRRKKAKMSPPAPTFPNGIADAPQEAVVRSSARPRRDTYSSCNCDQTGDCRCASPASQAGPAASPRDDDLMASLIMAAEAKLSPTLSEPNALQRPPTSQSVPQQAYNGASYASAGSCCKPSPSSSDPVQSSPTHPGPEASNSYSFPPLPQELDNVFKCCCGETCACPGCAEHRGFDALASSESCPTSCSSCFNCIVSTAPAIHDWIEATAAGLPEPPASRKIALDPTNVTVYPPIVWQNDAAARAAGLVKVPALCCGGKCGCPPNACACLDDCCGCCTGCACPEHETMPHYSGYQGTLRCNYQVSGERASCCDSKNSTPPPPEPPSFFSTTSFSGGMNNNAQGSSSSHNPLLSSAYPSQQQPQYLSQSPYHGNYRRLSEQKQYYTSLPSPLSPPRPATPSDTPLPRVPFQPAPGAFTLGQPNPQLMTASSTLPPLYHHSGLGGMPSAGYRERDSRQTLERVRG